MTCNGGKILRFVENDLLPNIDVEWEGEDITGMVIELHVRKPNGLRFAKTAIIDDPNVGATGSAKFHFSWSAGDLCPGDSQAEIQITNGGLNETFQGLILRVSEEIS